MPMSKTAVAIACTLAVLLPGSTQLGSASAMTTIKVATLAPRSSTFMRRFLRADKEIRKATGGKVGFRLYPSGVAGDETDVIRKMSIGQMDGGLVTDTALTSIVNEVGVMQVPGLVKTYAQVQAIQAALRSEWEEAFLESGYKLVTWGEGGLYRTFSNKPIRRPSDLRSTRPWLRPSSPVDRTILAVVGATGVPMDVREVYGGLQTGMIDTVYVPALGALALQWHSRLTHVSTEADGVLVGAMIVTKRTWDAIPPDAQGIVLKVLRRNQREGREEIRRADRNAYIKMVEAGCKAVPYSKAGRREFDEVYAKVRSRLTGRVYSAELLSRVQRVAEAAK